MDWTFFYFLDSPVDYVYPIDEFGFKFSDATDELLNLFSKTLFINGFGGLSSPSS